MRILSRLSLVTKIIIAIILGIGVTIISNRYAVLKLVW